METNLNSKGWHRADIRAELSKKGYTLKQLASKFGYGDNAITVCFGKPWPAVERIIADVLDEDPQNIWPDRYTKEGLPKSRNRAVRITNYAQKQRDVHIQTEDAA